MEIRLMARLFHINELRRDSLVVDDEPDVEVLFRQQFRRDLRADRYTMEFAQSAPTALQRITGASNRSLILILSDINMSGMSGLELLPKACPAAGRSDHHDHRLRRCGDQTQGAGGWRRGAAYQAHRFLVLRNEIETRVQRAA
jgi:hypothetical protein